MARHKVDSEIDDWQSWLKHKFPNYVNSDFGDRQITFWEWVEGIELGARSAPFVAIWPRGGAKSTSAELAVVRLGAKRTRNYVWYASETQEQADKHVETIASMLESPRIESSHPDLAQRKLGKYGNSRGWRRNRLRTASGLTVDAIGLDTATRGARIEEFRPDMIILDDVDDKHDTHKAISKKIDIITKSILPAGDNASLVVLFIQNMIHPNSIAAMLADGRADFLTDRIVSGPHPAVEDLEVEQKEGRFVITGGYATWAGQDLQVCQDMIDTIGITAFREECQHDVEAPPGGMWDHIEFRRCGWQEVPDLVRGCVWIDPAVTSTDQSDSMGIQADGIAENGTIYRLFSWEQVTTPTDAVKRGIKKALELGFTKVGIETDQGGDTWESVYWRAIEELKAEEEELPEDKKTKAWPSFDSDKAGAGYGSKIERNSRMLVDYEHGSVVHVRGTHLSLERALKRFPLTKPYDLVDAAFWSWYDLRESSAYGGIHV